jgi:acyl-CoA reductase-like NAD-dependent aldehyde dehydrogenase
MSTSYDGRAFINGERTSAQSQQTFDCISPVDGRLLTQVARCAEADIEAAVAPPAPPSRTSAGAACRPPRASG